MTLKLNAATGGGSVSLSAPNSTTSNLDVALTLPVDDGTSGQVLQTDGSGVLSWATASSDKITEGNTTAEVIDTGSDGRFVVTTEGTERLRVDSSGRLLVGTSSARTFLSWDTPQVQIEGTGYQQSSLSLYNNENTVNGAVLALGHSRGTSLGSNTVVSNGDYFGAIPFYGSDGSNELRGAEIAAYVDGTPGANDMPGRLVFSTTADGASSPTERMRISANGALLFGTTNTSLPSATTGIGLYYFPNNALTIAANGGNSCLILNKTDSTTGDTALFRYNGGTVGSITITTTSTAYNTSSDYRLKENVTLLTGATDRLQQIPVHRFNFIADPNKTVDGFLAHEVQAVVPECVTGEKDAVDDDGNPVYQGIDQSKLVPLLTAALQEAIGRIETLETANASLEARLTALEGGAS